MKLGVLVAGSSGSLCISMDLCSSFSLDYSLWFLQNGDETMTRAGYIFSRGGGKYDISKTLQK